MLDLKLYFNVAFCYLTILTSWFCVVLRGQQLLDHGHDQAVAVTLSYYLSHLVCMQTRRLKSE